MRNENSGKRFSFIDGPITANNPMGVHHAWGRTYKDLFQRYKTMQGYRQRYQNGFDGQGLWIEVNVEKELGIKSKRDIEKYGVDKFVEMCKDRVRRFADIQTKQSNRLGYWMDWENSYHTMSDENNYAIWHFLKECHKKGYVYEGRDVMPWCPRCATGISHHEIVTEGYKDINHPSIYIRFPIIDSPGESLLIWTTTPWTLAANVAAAVHPDATYAKVNIKGNAPDKKDEILYLMKSRLEVLKTEYTILEEKKGKELEGILYKAPFSEMPAQKDIEHRVVLWEEVVETEGTGIVHVAPGSGQEDFVLSKKIGLPAIVALDEFGNYNEGFDWLTGMNVADVNRLIYQDLRTKKAIYRIDQIKHRYPVCWRCDTELVFRLVDEWFISMDQLRDSIAGITKRIKWVPGFGMDRELDWLRNMDDWMISKKRYYGLALPIYKCDKCMNFDIIGSKKELQERAIEGWEEFEGHSPHKPWIDAVLVKCAECDNLMNRIKDVGNPWLDAGIVPFSTLGYLVNKDYWRDWFPADLISESFPGQFRNWFYSLLTMSTVLENREPFLANFTYATLFDSAGEAMHKSKGNSIEFEEGADKMGVDAMRWMYVAAPPAANLLFGFDRADEVRRRILIPLWNVYYFFITYANIDGYDPSVALSPPAHGRSQLDRWIISELNELISNVTNGLDKYQPDSAVRAIEDFVEYLSNWYIRRNRRRFWRKGKDKDKLAAYSTLYECLTTLVKLMAPIIPFMTEEMYRNLVMTGRNGDTSVHLQDWPKVDQARIDPDLDEWTRLAIRICRLGHAARSKAGIRVRQPLHKVVVSFSSVDQADYISHVKEQILEELNVKEVVDTSQIEGVIEFNVRLNLPMLGPKYGKRVRDIEQLISQDNAAEIARQVTKQESVSLGEFDLLPEELLVEQHPVEGYAVESEGGIAVAVDTDVSEELAEEGIARELIHRFQNLRRDAGFDITDRIIAYCSGPDKLIEVLQNWGTYICQEILTDRVNPIDPPESFYVQQGNVGGMDITVGVDRVDTRS
jgi:isoleucyl-tRNA synthetase